MSMQFMLNQMNALSSKSRLSPKSISAGKLAVIALVVALSMACSSTAVESDATYIGLLQDNRAKFNAVVELARERKINYGTVDLRMERDENEISRVTKDIIGKGFPVRLVEFRTAYIKLYFQIDGLVGVTSVFKPTFPK